LICTTGQLQTGKKTTILLEEVGIPYNIKPINIGRGDS